MKRGYTVLPVIFMLFFLADVGQASGIGMYGVGKGADPKTAERLRGAGVDRVFVPSDPDTIRFFKVEGFSVYISVNVFGGRQAWKKYPDARPIKADGSPIGEAEGEERLSGVCPTHPAWREERLEVLRQLVSTADASVRPDGIWLDFIRYPGFWETSKPVVPDTCFCARCLKRFSEETGVPLPPGQATSASSRWIYANAHLAWQRWKQAQIDAFVRKARQIVDESEDNALLLGVFTVPWTRSDFSGAGLFHLAQDPFSLSTLADVVSPMVYHRMCGRFPDWVGYVTRYLKETAQSRVWPIVQSVDVSSEGFSAAVRYAGRAGADALLVYSWKDMSEDLTEELGEFASEPNLISNPGFFVSPERRLPDGWDAALPSEYFEDRTTYEVRSSEQFPIRKHFSGLDPSGHCLGILAGEDRRGRVETKIPPCTPGTDYLLTARVYTDTWQRQVYPTLTLWGKEHLLDTLLQARTFQPVRIHHRCTGEEPASVFSFANPHRGRQFWLKSPKLSVHHPFRPAGMRPPVVPDFFAGMFFPIGVYGADLDRIDELRMIAVNTVVLGGTAAHLKPAVEKCHRTGMRYVISVPRDPAVLKVFLDRIRPFVQQESAAFYVNDEPGIWAFPRNRAEDIYRLVKQQFPHSAAVMAVVRPQVCRDFADAADMFMLDPYPVARRSLTRMAEVIDRCRADTGPARSASVIQAFGGRKVEWQQTAGWVRQPTWQEMDCLAFLSLVHGSRGIFFFTYKEIGKTDEGRQKLARVVGRLNRLYPWLGVQNRDEPIDIEMISENRFDPKGRAAVHACLKASEGRVLIIAVNAVEAPASARLRPVSLARQIAGSDGAPEEPLSFVEVFSGEKSTMTAEGLYAEFGPYEAKAWELEPP